MARVEYVLALGLGGGKGARAQGGRRKRCRFLGRKGVLRRKPAACAKRSYSRARGTSAWQVRLRRQLPAGRYNFYVRATDGAGNTSAPQRVRFTVG